MRASLCMSIKIYYAFLVSNYFQWIFFVYYILTIYCARCLLFLTVKIYCMFADTTSAGECATCSKNRKTNPNQDCIVFANNQDQDFYQNEFLSYSYEPCNDPEQIIKAENPSLECIPLIGNKPLLTNETCSAGQYKHYHWTIQDYDVINDNAGSSIEFELTPCHGRPELYIKPQILYAGIPMLVFCVLHTFILHLINNHTSQQNIEHSYKTKTSTLSRQVSAFWDSSKLEWWKDWNMALPQQFNWHRTARSGQRAIWTREKSQRQRCRLPRFLFLQAKMGAQRIRDQWWWPTATTHDKHSVHLVRRLFCVRILSNWRCFPDWHYRPTKEGSRQGTLRQ